MKFLFIFMIIFYMQNAKRWRFLEKVDRRLNPALLKAKLEVPITFTSLTP